MLKSCFALGLMIVTVSSPVVAQETNFGSREFSMSCAVCHGTDGKGNGPLAQILTVKPADLTVLAKNDNGKYPFLEVFQVIDGRTQVTGHGDRTMPIWGDTYEAEAGPNVGPYGSELLVRARILELVYYIQSIQQE